MVRILKKISGSIKGFFNKIIDVEAERVNELYCQIFGTKSSKGGED